jgi:hypothetical protein
LGDSSYILKSPLKNTNFSPTYADDLQPQVIQFASKSCDRNLS